MVSHMPDSGSARRLLLVGVLPILLTACATGAVAEPPAVAPVVAPTTAGASAPSGGSCTDRILPTLDARAKAGQLLMVGSALADPVGYGQRTVRRIRPAGVLLAGRSNRGVAAISDRTRALQGAATEGDPRIGMFVAADQEGGQVQVLSGDGFSDMPPATGQSTMTTSQLETAAQGWGRELRSAGVNLDLAPVADVLLPALGARNTSVGVSLRTYGTEPGKVAASILSVVGGLRKSGVDATVKHFPGLGQVAPNTDFSADVRDTTTGTTSPNLQPFRAAIEGGVRFVMVSSAIYTKIDRNNPAAFSDAVVTRLLRGELAFGGVVVSDDLGNAAAVRAVRPADRATRFVAAGGDLVLTVDPNAATSMLDGLTTRMATDALFTKQIDVAVRRVLEAKSALGLLHC